MTSYVVSIRLDDNDPDEAQALQVLADLQAQGWDKRTIFTRALLAAADKPLEKRPVDLVAELRQVVAEARELAAVLKRAPGQASNGSAPVTDEAALRPELRDAIVRAKRPGFKKGQ